MAAVKAKEEQMSKKGLHKMLKEHDASLRDESKAIQKKYKHGDISLDEFVKEFKDIKRQKHENKLKMDFLHV